MKACFLIVFSAAFFVLWTVAAPVAAQAPEETVAARETHIPSLRLYPPTAALAARGVRLAYTPHDVTPGNGRYSCGGLDARQMKQAASIAETALLRLPAGAWKTIDLKYILLCSEAKAGDRVIGGIPVPPLRLLMLGTGQSPGKAARFPYTLLHELYHMIEMQNGSADDAAWDRAFSGYRGAYDGGSAGTALGSGGPGFINGYGRSFPHEERAEIFAIHLLSAPDLQRHIAQARDTVLQRKLEAVRHKCRALLGTSC